jgi:hypothetical protein
MTGFASSLSFTSLQAYGWDEERELQNLRTPQLHQTVVAFFTNIFRLKRLHQLSSELSLMALVWGEAFYIATQAGDPSRAAVEFKQMVTARYDSPDDPRTAIAGNGLLTQIIDNTNDRLGPGLHAVLSAQVIGAWTACEVLAGDLWEEALNCHPGTLSNLGTGAGKIDVNKIATHRFQVQDKMGTILKDNYVFSKHGDIGNAYASAFSDATVTAAARNDSIKHLAALRHILVHRGGVADVKFTGQVTAHPVLSRFVQGDQITIDGYLASDVISSAISSMFDLIHAVDTWLVNNP